MFDFFTRNKSVVIEPLYRSGESLAFISDTLIDVNSPVSVQDRDGRSGTVQVAQMRRADDTTWMYFAVLLDGDLHAEPSLSGYQWRQESRLSIGLRARSPHLPDYAALTEDLSVEGAQLAAAAPLKVGQELDLHLDLDSGFPDVRVVARVCWSRMTEPYRAGVSFVDLDASTRNLLRSYLQARGGGPDVRGLEEVTPSEPGSEASRLEKLAVLKSSFDDGKGLVLQLVTHDEVMEIRFENPKVLRCEPGSQLVANIVTTPMLNGQTRTALLDAEGQTLVEIESVFPDIVCRGLRTHDLG